MISGDFCVVGVGEVFHNATHFRSRLKLWNESGTNRARIADSTPLRLRSPQYLALAPHIGTRSSLARVDKGGHGNEILKMCGPAESNQKAQRVNWIHGLRHSGRHEALEFGTRLLPPPCGEGRRRAAAHCVLATRGGVAWVMNWVASSMAVPSGVGTAIRNGTRMRVPATGAKATSMLRCAVRYLMTARSGM
jgi:hypothetical protein